MTGLQRPVRRESNDFYGKRPLIIELSRDGVRVKEKGRRTWFGPYRVIDLYRRLAAMEADRIVRERKARNKARREAR